MRGKYVNKARHILINNWEATFFDFNEQKLLNLAKKASHVGIEMFVLDDGWFGHRNSDDSSLGDWFVDKCKLPQGEITHRYVLGLYYIMQSLTDEFPDILFESCSSGGGRFDAGMLYYMPQTWCSDNTDAVCRMKIQYATSFMFPPITLWEHM